jgi:glutamate/tyrosine decarboxylase-like PLP-dependent enzyme
MEPILKRRSFPDAGAAAADVLAELEQAREGDIDWRGGRSALFVFSARDDVDRLGQAAFNAFFSENALGARRAFPSLLKMEQEVVAKGLELFQAPDGAGGNMTSGGTESIVMAVKTARDFRRARRGRGGNPLNIVAAATAHPAFDKAAALMDLDVRRVPVSRAFAADVEAIRSRIDEETFLIVGSAPSPSYGVVDPIGELGALAKEKDVWLHVDACIGGWIGNFVRDLGYPVPAYDFSVEGVSSLSADLHKFGFCPKPASTVFYRDAALQAHQQFDFDVWPSGPLITQTLVGTRPGGGVAAAWAVLTYLGRDGYRAIARDLLNLRQRYFEALSTIPGVKIRGAPHLFNIAFGLDDVDIRQAAEELKGRGWLADIVNAPPSLHIMIVMRHEPALQPYVADLSRAVAALRRRPGAQTAAASYL